METKGNGSTDTLEENPGKAKKGPRYTGHPWRSLLVIVCIQGICYWLGMFIISTLLKLPVDLQNIQALPTVILFTVSGLVAYVIAPYFLRIPLGRRTFREYLDDIRLTRTRPFFRLLILTLSCDLILILCQGSGSIVYRLSEGNPVTAAFLIKVFDLTQVLPPKSWLLFAMFFSMFEEVAFRGVLITMLLDKHSMRRAILYSAIAFGVLHLPAVFAGRPVVSSLAQVIWAFLFGLFYGYLFIKSGSLLPSMIIHWLANVFQEPLTTYWTTATPVVSAIYSVVFGYGLAALLLILWVRFFCNRWLQAGESRSG